jgi:hypothetical protein
MKTISYLSKETSEGQAIASKIHAALATITELIREARKQNIVVHLEGAHGFSASGGVPLTAKITATIVFGVNEPSIST